MPTIRLGGGVQDARGSLGGQTIRKGRFGHLLQSRRGPVNKRTPRQSKARSIFQRLTQYWSNDLSQAQRDQWNLYGKNITVHNRFGQSMHLTGFHQFIRSNSLLLQFEEPIHDDGPVTFTLPRMDPTIMAQFNFVTQRIIVFFDETQAWVNNTDGHLYLTMSQPHSPGIRNFNKSFRLLGLIHGSDSDPPTSPQELDAVYPVANGNHFVLRTRIAEEHGRLSNFFRSTYSTSSCSRGYSIPVGLC